MSITFIPNIQPSNNQVLPLSVSSSGATVRLASLSAGVIGYVQAIGYAGKASDLSLSVQGCPSAITYQVSTTSPDVIYFSFSGITPPNEGMYNFYLQAYDGVTLGVFPISVDVKPPFSIAEQSGRTLFTVPAFNAFADIVIQGYGVNNETLQGGVEFILPASLPAGLLWVTNDDNLLKLRAQPSTSSQLSGGLQPQNGISQNFVVPVSAYAPGTMYDTPDRAFTQHFTFTSSASTPGVLSGALGVYWDSVNQRFDLNFQVDTLNGPPVAYTYTWKTSGISGNTTSGGGPNNTTMTWVPTYHGNITFVLVVTNPQTLVSTTFTTQPISVAPSGAWSGVAVPLTSSLPFIAGPQGAAEQFTLSTDPATISVGSNVAISLALLDPITLTPITATLPSVPALTAAIPQQTVSITIPANSSLGNKWILLVSATNGAETGNLYLPVKCAGSVALVPSISSLTLSQVLGNVIPASQVISASDGSGNAVSATYELIGAPDGVSIATNGSISGKVLNKGVFDFQIEISAPNYTSTFIPVALTVSQGSITPVLLNGFSSSPISDGTANLDWSYSGTADGQLDLQINQNLPLAVSGTSYNAQVTANSVFSLVINDFIGPNYTTPVVALTADAAEATQLPPATLTIGYINQSNELLLNWNPAQVDGSFSLYQGWDIQAKLSGDLINITNPDGTPLTGMEEGGIPTALNCSYSLPTASPVSLNMYPLSNNVSVVSDGAPWSSFLAFPPVLTTSSITLSTSSASMGQTVNVSVNISGADAWRIVYSDGISSVWRPMSTSLDAHIFNVAGNASVTLETQNDFGSVKLRRSWTVPLYILNQVYNPNQAPAAALMDNIGIGGEQGFEITNASQGAVANQPYEVILRALVKDEMTQEIKLLLATSRTPDASSQYGTMAVDVFPLEGRPHSKDLIKPSLQFGDNQEVPPVSITTTTLPNAIVGKAMSEFELTASGGVSPYIWFSDNLPPGMQLSTDGTLSGMTMTLGSFPVDISVQDSNDPPSINQLTLNLDSISDLAITTGTLPSFPVTSTVNFQIVGSNGVPPYTWSLVGGKLPTGLSLSQTGVIQGVAASYLLADFSTPFNFTVEVADAIGSTVSANLIANITPLSLSFGNVDQNTIFSGQDFKLVIPVYGGTPPYMLERISSVPAGLIQNPLSIINPPLIPAVSGQISVPLSIVTGNQSYTFNYGDWVTTDVYAISFNLAATGGSAPYAFSLDTTDSTKTTLVSARISSTGLVTGLVSINATLPSTHVNVMVRVTDTTMKTVTQNIQITANLIGVPGAIYTLVPASAAFATGASGTNPTSQNFPVTLTDLRLETVLPTFVPGQALTRVYGMTLGMQLANGTTQLFNLGQNPPPLSSFKMVSSFNGASFSPSLNDIIAVGDSGFVANQVMGDDVVGCCAVATAGQQYPGLLWYLSNWPMSLPSSTTNGSNTWSGSLNANMSTYQGSNGEIINGQISLLIGEGTTMAPSLSVIPSINVNYLNSNNVDGSSSYSVQDTNGNGDVLLFDYSSSVSGGVAPYTYSVNPAVNTLPGLYFSGNQMFLDSSIVTGKYLDVFDGTQTIINGVTITDANGASVNTNYILAVTRIDVSNLTMIILKNTIGSVFEVGVPVKGSVQASNTANWTVVSSPSGTTSPSLTPASSTNSPYWSGSFSSPATDITYTVTAVSTTDPSKAASQTYDASLYTRSITISVPTTPLIVDQSYTNSTNNSKITVTLNGYTLAEAENVVISLSQSPTNGVGVLSGNWSQGTGTLTNGTYPVCTQKVGFIGTQPGNWTVTVSDPLRPLLTKNATFATGFSPVSATANTSSPITISEFDVIPGLGSKGTNQATYSATTSTPCPFTITGGTGPFVVSVLSAYVSTGFPAVVSTLGGNVVYNIGQVGAVSGSSVTYTVNFKITDSNNQTTTVQCTQVFNVVAATALQVNLTNKASLLWADGLTNSYEFAGWVGQNTINGDEFWSVSAGHEPYHFDVVVNLNTPEALYLTTSPSQRIVRYNNTLASYTDYDLDGDGNISTVAYTVPAASPNNVTYQGTYNIPVTVTVTDSLGITGSATGVLAFTVPDPTMTIDTNYTQVPVNTSASGWSASVALNSGLKGGTPPYVASLVSSSGFAIGTTPTVEMLNGIPVVVGVTNETGNVLATLSVVDNKGQVLQSTIGAFYFSSN
jgi:hypothetical protein